MASSTRKLLLWSPRILGIVVTLYLGHFALDEFGKGLTFAEALPTFVLHAVPSVLLLMAVALAWRWEWVGGTVFILLAVLYAATTWRRVDWVLAISGLLLGVGALYLWSKRARRGRGTGMNRGRTARRGS